MGNTLQGATGSARASAATAPSSSAAAPVVAAPDGYVRVHVTTVVATDAGAAVLLSPDPSAPDAKLLPIFIGGTEALSIDLRLRGDRYARPLTHDLMDDTLAKLGSKVLQARIVRLSGTTFIGAVIVSRGAETIEIDARPSDAIGLALGNDAEIWVAKDVLDKAGVTKQELGDPKERKRGDPTML